jgi:hypothetical protein
LGVEEDSPVCALLILLLLLLVGMAVAEDENVAAVGVGDSSGWAVKDSVEPTRGIWEMPPVRPSDIDGKR